MNIFIRVKAAGKRRAILELQPKVLPDNIDTAEKLITHLVLENVQAYNTKPVDEPFFQYLTQQQLNDGIHIGKVSFGDRRNEQQQDEQQAVKNALQCFEDGIFRVLVNETEITDPHHITLRDGDVLTFIRLAMLAGRRF